MIDYCHYQLPVTSVKIKRTDPEHPLLVLSNQLRKLLTLFLLKLPGYYIAIEDIILIT